MEDDPADFLSRAAFLSDPGLAAVWDALPGARVVGGAVRDTIAGRPVTDIDLATPQPPGTVLAALAAAGLRGVPTGLPHGTVTAIADSRPFEVTTLRRDIATDGRHATVAFTDDWLADAARRDFTINAMSVDRAGRLHDPFGGRADLAAGQVRFVGDARARIAEDYLRALRFFRFHARYGLGAPGSETLAAVTEAVSGLARLSPERVWSELKRILAADRPEAALAAMRDTGVLAAVLPEAAQVSVDHLPPDPLLRLAALLDGQTLDIETLAGRLRLSGAERDHLVALLGPAPAEDANEAELRRALADAPAETLDARVRLARRTETLRRRLAAIEAPVFPLQGRDLVAAGVPAGPAVGGLLRILRASWRQGGCVAGRDALLAELAARRGGW